MATSVPIPLENLAPTAGQRAWAVLGFFVLLWLFCFVDVFIVGALLSPMKAELRISDQELGRLNAATILSYIAVVPLSGYLGDRWPRKGMMLAALVVLSVGAIGSGFAGGYGALLLWRAVVGVGDGAFSTLSQTWIADLFPARHRSIAFAILMSTGQFAAWTAYGFGSLIAEHSSWHQAFIIGAIPSLVLGLGLWFLREPPRTSSDGSVLQDIPRPSHGEIAGLLRLRSYQLYLAAYVFRLVAIGGWFFWSAQLLQRHYGVPAREAVNFIGSTYVLSGVPGILLSGVVAGWLARRRFRGAYSLWLVVSDVLAGVTVTAILVLEHRLIVVKSLLLVQTFFAGLGWGVVAALPFELVPARVRNTAVSLAMVAQNIGSAFLASVLIGMASDRFGIERALLVIPIGYFAAAFFSSALTRWERRHVVEAQGPSVLAQASASSAFAATGISA
jgi:predicted MFS family arabinose efflux permease